MLDARDGNAWLRAGPDVLVVDDPSAAIVRGWVQRARLAGVPVATIHDLGITATESDVVIDGSVQRIRRVAGRFGTLVGTAYAILDPSVRAARERVFRPAAPRVLIALGGGQNARLAARIANALAERVPDVEVRVAGGFAGGRRPTLSGAKWIEAPDGLAAELMTATVAILAGGVTLYEACAIGVPAVAVALSRMQHITVRGIARAGAAIADASRTGGPAAPIPLTALIAAADRLALAAGSV